MKKIVTVLVAVIATLYSYAQNTLEVVDTGNITRERWRDSVLRIDKAQIPTGFLLEYSMFGFESSKHDGTGNNDDTLKNDGRIFELHNILFHSKVNTNATIALTDSLFSKAFFAHRNQDVIPLTFVFQPYNRIRPTALSEGLFSIAPDSVGILDVPNRPSSPYDQYEIFAFAPFKTKITKFNAINFILPDDLFYMQGITTVEIDFNDGAGFRQLNKGGSVSIYYATEGLKYLTARITTSSGVRTAKSIIDYKRPTTYRQPNYTWNIEVDPVYTNDSEYLSEGSQMQMQTLNNNVIPCSGGSFIDRLLCAQKPNARIDVLNGCDNVFDKPIIIVEGFDPDGSLTIDEMIDRFDNASFIETMLAYGYDFVFVDFTKNSTYIENNARVLEAVINQVNATKVGNHGSSIIGFSMGGLITRWCLKDMEDRSLQHHVTNYFSYDAPHQGANLPLGMQYIFKEMVFDMPYLRFSSDLRSLSDAFESPAARQMLVTYGSYTPGLINWFPNLTTLDPLRAAFAQRLQAKGYPQQTNNFGVAFGRGNNTANTKNAGVGNQFTINNPFGPQSEIFNGVISYLLVNVEAIARAVPENNAKATIGYYGFAGITWRKIFGIPYFSVALRIRRFDYTGQYPYDDAMGSFEITQSQFQESWPPSLGGPATTNGHAGHNFVATASALDLQNQGYSSTTKWQSNNMFFNIDNEVQNIGQIAGNTLVNSSLSPFDAVITSTTETPFFNWNIFHNADISFQIANFIERKILNAQPINCAGTNGLCNSNPAIAGPITVCSTGQYQISPLPQGVTINWQIQNGRLGIINGQGTNSINVTKINDGSEIVKATLTNACGVSITLSLNVVVGNATPDGIVIDTETPLCINERAPRGIKEASVFNYSNNVTYEWRVNNIVRGTNSPFIGIIHSWCTIGTNTVSVRAFSCNTWSNPVELNFEAIYCEPEGYRMYTLSPNPVNSSLAVESKSESKIQEVRIKDKLGAIRINTKYKNDLKKVVLDLSRLQPDIYYVEIFDGKTWSTEKIIKL